MENIEENKTQTKIEIEEHNSETVRSQPKPKGSNNEKKQRFSLFEIKKRLILKEFINILKKIN